MEHLSAKNWNDICTSGKLLKIVDFDDFLILTLLYFMLFILLNLQIAHVNCCFSNNDCDEVSRYASDTKFMKKIFLILQYTVCLIMFLSNLYLSLFSI